MNESTRRKVLLVEDTLTCRFLIEKTVESLGFEVVCAGDGLAGLELASHLRPSIIITDVMMPKLNGFDLARKVREIPGMKDTRVIFLSAMDSRDERFADPALGPVQFLQKPIKVAILKAALVAMSQDLGVQRPAARVFQAPPPAAPAAL